MPLYEYECRSCGGFSETRPMVVSGLAVTCPTCAKPAPRVLSASAVGRGRRRRGGHPDPILVKADREPPKPRATVSHGDRPWMLGH
jgi:putative FmdB family regulatory protein